MKIITQPDVARAVEAYQEYFSRRKTFVAMVKEQMAALDAERDQLIPVLASANRGKAFSVACQDSDGVEVYKVVDFYEKPGRLDAEAMAYTLKSIRRKPQRLAPESVVLLRDMTEDEIELLPK